MAKLKKADIGISTFLAAVHPTDTCGTNGLPLTPNSIVIYGQFQKLKTMHHPNICEYLDIVRGKHERMVVVAEHYKSSLVNVLGVKKIRDFEVIKIIAYEVVFALTYLNSHGILHRSLCLENILLDDKGKVKLSQYGRYYMTNCGTAVDFPIGCPKYLAPELLLRDSKYSPLSVASSPKVDVWSLGIILTEIVLEGMVWPNLSKKSDVKTIFEKILSLYCKEKDSALHSLLEEHAALEKLEEIPPALRSFIQRCLTIKYSERPNPIDLLSHDLFSGIDSPDQVFEITNGNSFPAVFRSGYLELPVENLDKGIKEEDLLSERTIQETYHLWTLAGGDVFGELKKYGLLKTFPPVCNMPNVILHGGDTLGVAKDRNLLFDDSVVCLSLDRVRERMSHVEPAAHFPLLVEKDPCSWESSEMRYLPVVIRERDVEYQFSRIVIFQRLLDGYPYTRDKIIKEARVDIPPLLRAKVWAALLDVNGDVTMTYDSIDKESVTPTDRQIEVDIPRCHQYHQLLASPTAHGKFKRLLKAWVVSHPGLVYWQGLDSLCAPFLSLNFGNEALAYCCLRAFIPKYLYNFFLKDNSHIIQEYLAVFCQLIAFHDPELFNHLHEIGFQPELYAIPWFLTMFTHVFPLHKIYHLWDTLLLGNSSFPLYIGVAILQQLRTQLLTYGFNECILLFSDMPEIDIERCVHDSIKIFQSSPKSVATRQYDGEQITSSSEKQQEITNSKNKTGKKFLTVSQLKSEKCPRISVQDMLQLLDMRNGEKKVIAGKSTSESQVINKMKTKAWGIAVDVRPQDEYDRGHVEGSINMPSNQTFLESDELSPGESSNTLVASKGKIVIVVGGRANNCPKFAEQLLCLGFPRVCVLDAGGMATIRSAGLFSVPPV